MSTIAGYVSGLKFNIEHRRLQWLAVLVYMATLLQVGYEFAHTAISFNVEDVEVSYWFVVVTQHDMLSCPPSVSCFLQKTSGPFRVYS